MKNSKLGFGIATLSFLLLPFSAAFAASVTVQALTPGGAVMAKTNMSFNIVATGFVVPTYKISDSFSATSISNSNIGPVGQVSWTPSVTDVGTHVLTITVTDSDSNYATMTQTITVSPPPSLTVSSISPASGLIPGNKFTFTVTPTGFTNPTFSIGDAFGGGSSVVKENLSSAGNFSWTPDVSQNGDHTITIYGMDSLGHNASINVPFRVGAGPTLVVQPITPGSTISHGQFVTFGLAALNFSPTGFTVSDAFSGTSSISNTNINTTGTFAWTPQPSDAGTHLLTITGRVGAYGDSASTAVTLTVLGPGGTAPANTVASSTAPAGLSALQAQLAALQSKIASQTSASAPAPALMFTLNLHSGSNGEDVTALQKVLSQQGFFSTEPNGNFGPATLAAVKKFQAAHGLDPLGIVGPATRSALNAVGGGAQTSSTPTTTSTTKGMYIFEHFMGVGDDDSDVIELQKRLHNLGYMTSAPTGYYGSATETAVKKFQNARSIPATGYVNSVTRAVLNQ